LSTAVPACGQEPGVIYPVVDLKICEGKGDCSRVCPEDVFEVKRIEEQDYRSLGGTAQTQVAGSWIQNRVYPER
jgi:ferredoxin